MRPSKRTGLKSRETHTTANLPRRPDAWWNIAPGFTNAKVFDAIIAAITINFVF
jgi:hypothetical protein